MVHFSNLKVLDAYNVIYIYIYIQWQGDMCHSGEYMARSSRMGVKCAFLNSIKNRHVSKIAWLDHYTCQLSAIDILCQAQFLSWYTLVRVIFFLSQKEDKVKGMSTWWTYKHIFPFYFAKRNRIVANGQ